NYILHFAENPARSYIEFDGINLDASAAQNPFGLVKAEIVNGVGESHHIRMQNAEWILGDTVIGFLNSGDLISNYVVNELIHLKACSHLMFMVQTSRTHNFTII